jgi:hypothetical protein
MRRTGINNWYVPADADRRLGLLGRWQFFSKFYLGTPFRRWRKARRRRRDAAAHRQRQALGEQQDRSA